MGVCCNLRFVRPEMNKVTAAIERPLGFFVRCGKCTECLKLRQNDFACRIARESYYRGSLVHVTFTYRPDKLPFSCRLFTVDTDTGEICYPYKSLLLKEYNEDGSPNSLLAEVRKGYVNCFERPGCLVSTRPLPSFDFDGVSYYYDFAPSLNREDFRLWLKRSRVSYERKHGVKLPSFSYACIGEYGSRTSRPHMHCAFMGLTFSQVVEICFSWRKDFGNCKIKAVRCVNKDGSPGFIKAAKYLGKYFQKGSFDSELSRSGLSQKGRLCCSLNMGTKLSYEDISYYSAFDLFGWYDPERLCTIDGRPLSDFQKRAILRETYKRSKVCVGSEEFLMPRAMRNKLWKFPIKVQSNKTGKLYVYHYKTCKLQRESSAAMASDFLRMSFKPFFECAAGKSLSDGYAEIRSLIRCTENSTVSQEKTRVFDFAQRYVRDVY